MLDVSRGWYVTLAAAPELVPAVRLNCLYDYEDEDSFMEALVVRRRNEVFCPQCSHAVCAKLRTALGRLRSLSRRTLRVRLDGYDWTLVSSCIALLFLCSFNVH